MITQTKLSGRLVWASIIVVTSFNLFVTWNLNRKFQTYKLDIPKTALQLDLSREHKFITDVGYYHFTSHEGKIVSNWNFFSVDQLKKIPRQLGEWKGVDYNPTFKELVHYRRYTDQKKNKIWFISVYGENEVTFHTPEICYANDGWEIITRKIKSIKLKGEEFRVRYMLARSPKSKTLQLLLYWYMWPNSLRKMSDGAVLFRVAFNVDEEAGIEEAENKSIDFIRQILSLKFEEEKREKEPEFITYKPVVLPTMDQKLTTRQKLKIAQARALNWMKRQVVPNAIIPEPQMDRRNLILSFELNREKPVGDVDKNFRFMFGRSFIYDNALAIIAFTMTNNLDQARLMIDAFKRLYEQSGHLWFGYNTNNEWPSSKDSYGAIIRSGANGWMGYAITYYLRTRLLKDPDLINKDQELRDYLNLAQKMADYLLEFQVTQKGDPRLGFVTGGEGWYYLKKERGQVVEKFSKEKVMWASVEHNIDIYYFLRDLGRLTGSQRYVSAAQTIKDVLLSKAWNEKLQQFNQGQRLDGADTAQALDTASWGAILLASLGDKAKALQALKATDNYKVFDPEKNKTAYTPYRDQILFEDEEVGQFYFSKNPKTKWDDLEVVWPEGTIGVALAHIKLGQRSQAINIIENILAYQTENGGFLYANKNIPFNFSINPSVAGTAWLIIALSALNDDDINNLFWGG